MFTGRGAYEGDPSPESTVRYFVTGACGQIGAELVPFLRKIVGKDNVIASDVKTSRSMLEGGPFAYLDVQDKDNMARLILENGVTHVVHLATLLSAVGERNPALALKVNIHGCQNVLELAAQHHLAVYAPSTIAVFGANTPRHGTPDDTVMRPSTIYGITKVHQELLGQYYAEKHGVDYRSLRYPGIISSRTAPGGGTTDYAVEIFHAALARGAYTCFLSADAELPMMHMDDCLGATYALMSAPRDRLTRTTYNVTATSFTPAQLGAAIARQVPGFEVTYSPDFRDAIARTWPASIDDSAARADWGWAPKHGIDELVSHMLRDLAPVYEARRAAA
ncbi:MAG: NAD(P)-binding protein [Monoraphidium minutum]|nr:MAG: NAD(P)-binding protein [Monoraphidium minutum]